MEYVCLCVDITYFPSRLCARWHVTWL
jgi:hypothetical protein